MNLNQAGEEDSERIGLAAAILIFFGFIIGIIACAVASIFFRRNS